MTKKDILTDFEERWANYEKVIKAIEAKYKNDDDILSDEDATMVENAKIAVKDWLEKEK